MRTLLVVVGGVRMLPAFQPDDDLHFQAHEVDNIVPDRTLPAEFVAVNLAAAKFPPKAPLGIGRIFSERSGALDGHSGPLPSPPPKRERELRHHTLVGEFTYRIAPIFREC